MSAFLFEWIQNKTRFIDDPYRTGGGSNHPSSYFVLYFYLKESLGKGFCFHRAKTI